MSPLAIKNSANLDISQFDMRSIFLTESTFFKQFSISEEMTNYIEIIVAVFLLIIISPLLLVVSILIKLTMGKDVFYNQVRVGKKGKHFSIYKFRTMVANAEKSTGAILASKHDPRVTALGRILRASHIDELPQLINVIKGEMSFVGPRPERPEFVNKFVDEIEGYQLRHSIRPGITGLAQICLPYDASAQEKLQYDRFYISNRQSLLFNAIIVYYTGLKMMTFFILPYQDKISE